MKGVNMECKEAKQKDIRNFLSDNGIHPETIRKGIAWYYSPFRKEKTASFNVNLFQNVWYDFGTGEGGNIIDLIAKLKDVGVSEALRILESSNNIDFERMPGKKENKTTTADYRFIKLNSSVLIDYLRSRKISYNIANRYLWEARKGKFFGLAFFNYFDGCELINKGFKGSIAPKYISIVRGQKSDRVNVFEGVMDFLSALEYYKQLAPGYDTIILNSVGMIGKLNWNSKNINAFLDNDKAGREALKEIQKNAHVTDKSNIYSGYKDFNEFLKNKNI